MTFGIVLLDTFPDGEELPAEADAVDHAHDLKVPAHRMLKKKYQMANLDYCFYREKVIEEHHKSLGS